MTSGTVTTVPWIRGGEPVHERERRERTLERLQRLVAASPDECGELLADTELLVSETLEPRDLREQASLIVLAELAVGLSSRRRAAALRDGLAAELAARVAGAPDGATYHAGRVLLLDQPEVLI